MYQPWVCALVLVNCYNAYMNNDIPETVKVPAFILNAYYLEEFNRNYKKKHSNVIQRIKNLTKWVKDGIGKRTFHGGVTTSAAGFPEFKERHLFKGSAIEQGAAALFESEIASWLKTSGGVRKAVGGSLGRTDAPQKPDFHFVFRW